MSRYHYLLPSLEEDIDKVLAFKDKKNAIDIAVTIKPLSVNAISYAGLGRRYGAGVDSRHNVLLSPKSIRRLLAINNHLIFLGFNFNDFFLDRDSKDKFYVRVKHQPNLNKVPGFFSVR
jgi:hypothetical protein